MKTCLLLVSSLFLVTSTLSAQTTGTFIVTDNANRMSSCEDTLVTLADIYTYTGIRDLNDPNDDVSMYRMLRLQGSVITEEVITGPVKYSDYETIYIEKTNTPFNGHNGLVIFFNIIQSPGTLFLEDTVTYTVDKGTTANQSSSFVESFSFWSSGKDVLNFDERIFLTNEATGITIPMSDPNFWRLGKGSYKIKAFVSVCSATDLLWDSMFVVVNESPCLNVAIKNLPSVCSDEIVDITPYVYIDNHIASAAELADMKFYNRSNLYNPNAGSILSPSAINIGLMKNKTNLYPKIELTYQPNVTLGVCPSYSFMMDTKIPSKFAVTNIIFTRDNYGTQRNFQIDGDYYGFNNSLSKDVFTKLYLDNFNLFSGTTFNFYTDSLYHSPAMGNDLSTGQYYLLATNPACSKDSSVFNITVKNKDFDITWQSAQNLGKGYYTFNAPLYDGASYGWFAWGGSIVAGLGTSQITVYYSETAASAVTVSCEISLTNPSARTTADVSTLHSAVYITTDDDTREEIVTAVTDELLSVNTSSVYPNPATGSFTVFGDGEYALKMYNTLGETVYENNAYVGNTSINIQNKGLHIIHLSQQGKTQLLKVVLQ